MLDLLITNGKVYIDKQYQEVNIGIKDEYIVYIGLSTPEAKEIYDVEGKYVLPGLIDPHVHFALNGGYVSVDDFYYGSKSAAFGGITTVIDFLDPSRNAKELEESFNKRKLEAEKCNIDYHFHACIREPNGDLEEYVLKMKELGLNTVKLFTTYSETHRRTYDKDIIELLKLSNKYNFIVTAHIENDEMINKDESLLCTDVAEARNSNAETSEALKLCKYAVDTNGHLYMVHCSSGYTLDKIVKQYSKYLNKNIFVESCPQYFLFTKDILKSPKGYLYTFAPPLRSEEERKLLCVNFDYLSTIGTDHCAYYSEQKKNHPLLKGHPLGVGGVEASYLVMSGLFGDKIIEKMCTNPANIFGLTHKNGIKINNFADLIIVENKENIIGKPNGKCDYSIYENMKVDSKIISTLSRGHFVVKNGEFIENKGRLI